MDTCISAREWYERGRTLRQNKMYAQPLADLQKAAKNPNYAGQAYTQTALCLRALGRHEEAVAALHYALNASSISPNESLQSEHKAIAFAAYNQSNLEQDIAKGHGEYLASVSSLLGVSEGERPAFALGAQSQFQSLVRGDDVARLQSLRALVK